MKAHIKWPTYCTNIKPGGLTFVENCIILFQILLRIVHSDSEQREGRTEGEDSSSPPQLLLTHFTSGTELRLELTSDLFIHISIDSSIFLMYWLPS